MKGSIIIPVFNEEVFLEDFFSKLYEHIVSVKNFEFIFVDDGSTDYSLKILKKIASDFENIKIISLDKNYGKQVAITAGMKEAIGDFVIVTAISPYNPYLAVNEAVKKWQEGYYIVRAVKSKKASKSMFSKMGEFLFENLAKFFISNQTVLPKATVELFDRDVVDVLNSLKEKNMLLRSIDPWLDYSTYTFLYNPGTINYVKEKEYSQLAQDYNKLRQKEKMKVARPLKTRLYGPSLYAGATFFALFALCAILLAVFYSTTPPSITFLLFLWMFMITSLVASLLFGCRGWIIKRIGIVPYIKKDEVLYIIKEKYVSKWR